MSTINAKGYAKAKNISVSINNITGKFFFVIGTTKITNASGKTSFKRKKRISVISEHYIIFFTDLNIT